MPKANLERFRYLESEQSSVVYETIDPLVGRRTMLTTEP